MVKQVVGNQKEPLKSKQHETRQKQILIARKASRCVYIEDREKIEQMLEKEMDSNREKYATHMAKEFGLPAPLFKAKTSEIRKKHDKIVDSE
jgi:glutathione peroxidase-family protein